MDKKGKKMCFLVKTDLFQVDYGLRQGRASFGMAAVGPHQLPCLRGKIHRLHAFRSFLTSTFFIECPDSPPVHGHLCNSPGIQVQAISR